MPYKINITFICEISFHLLVQLLCVSINREKGGEKGFSLHLVDYLSKVKVCDFQTHLNCHIYPNTWYAKIMWYAYLNLAVIFIETS